MFKGLKSGFRRSSGSGRTARVSTTQMGHGRDIADEQRRRPAFLPQTPQEQGWDGSKTSRVTGLSE